MFRVAVTSSQFNEPLVHLSLLTGIEAVVLHFNIFAKFWVGIYNNKTTNRWVTYRFLFALMLLTTGLVL